MHPDDTESASDATDLAPDGPRGSDGRPIALEEYDVTTGPTVTLDDIAAFRPVTPNDITEPNGWGIVTRPVNFVSGATTQIIGGTLLDRPADVRFTPIGYGWDFGDGTTDTFTTPGATWKQLRAAELAPTATSHTYPTRGTYTVTPNVTYRAEYRFNGSPWLPIPGTLTLQGTPRSLLIGRIDTVLVNGDCHQNPHGPGC